MNSQTVNGRAELTNLVKACLERAPIILGAPVIYDLDKVGKGDALFPSAWIGCGTIDGFGLWQACRGQPCAKIVKISVRCAGFKCAHGAGWAVHEMPLPDWAVVKARRLRIAKH